MPFQTHIATAVMDSIFNASTFPTWTGNLYASLHSTTLALSVTCNGDGEVNGGSYVRQEVSGGAAADGAAASDAVITFTVMPQTTVYTIGLNTSSSSGGKLVWQTTLTASKSVAAGDSVQFAVGSITGTST